VSYSLSHPVLGQLNWDDKYQWWESKIYIGKVQVELLLRKSSDQVEGLTNQFALLVARLNEPNFERGLRLKIAESLRNDYIEHIKIIRTQPLDIESFASKMRLEHIAFSDGQFSLSYDDGGLFAGHILVGHFDSSGNLKDADIAG